MKLGLACRSTFSLKAIVSLAMWDHLYCNVAQKKEKKWDDKFHTHRSSLYEKFGIHLHSHIPLPRSYQIAAQYPMNT